MYVFVRLFAASFVCLFACLLVCLFLCAYLSVCQLAYLLLSSHPYIGISLHPSMHLSLCFFFTFDLFVFVCLFNCLFVRPLVRPAICLSVCLPACLSVCLSVSVPPFARSLSRSSISFVLVDLPFQAAWRLCFYASVLPTTPSNGHRLKHMAWMVSTFELANFPVPKNVSEDSVRPAATSFWTHGLLMSLCYTKLTD